MKLPILCLMPTYGRRKSLLEESIRCFVNQDHSEKFLLIYDDLGTLVHTRYEASNVTIMSTRNRQPSVGSKYNTMIDFAIAMSIPFQAVAVWDDDDVYLPQHLSAHAKVLESGHKWSKPSRIISEYHNPPKEEDASGRFHGSIATWRDNLKHVGGWIDTTRATFDQEFLRLLQRESPPGDPCDHVPPQYVYRWQTSGGGHCSALMGKDSWYADYQPDSTEPIVELQIEQT